MADANEEVNVADQKDAIELEAPDISMFLGSGRDADEDDKSEKAKDEAKENVEEEDEADVDSGDTADTEESKDDGEDDENVLSQEIDIASIEADDIPDYLNQLYDQLDDSARRDWLSDRDGRIGKDVGKFRKETAIAKEEREATQAKYDALLAKSTVDPSNPFSALSTEEEIQSQEDKINGDLAYVEKWLDSDEDYLDVGDKTYSAKEVAKWPLAWTKQLRLLDQQKGKVANVAKSREKAAMVEEKLSEDYEWFSDESSDTYKEYQKLRKDPKWSMVLDFIPELASELPRVLASYVSEGVVKKPRKALPARGARKPKGNIGNAAGSSVQSGRKGKIKAKANENLFNGRASEIDGLQMFMD
jgi:hypothetical protein